MAKFIRRKEIRDVTVDYYEHVWNYFRNGGGFGFPCTKDGHIDRSKLCPEAIRNLDIVIPRDVSSGVLIDGGIHHIHYLTTEKIPGVIECDNCGRHLEVDGFTNTCECGADYNWSGQRLADRSQWGEDTGETEADLIGDPWID